MVAADSNSYAGKADLFLALLDRQLRRARPEWEEAFAPEKLREERVPGVERMLTQGGQECADTMLQLEYFLYAMRNPAVRTKLAGWFEQMRSEMSAMLGRHFAEADARPPITVEQLAWVLAATELGIHIQACIDPEAIPDGIWGAVTRFSLDRS